MYSLRNKNTGSYLVFPPQQLWLTTSIGAARAMLSVCREIGIENSTEFDAEALEIIDLPVSVLEGAENQPE